METKYEIVEIMSNFQRSYFLFFGIINTLGLLIAFFYSLNVINEYFSYFTVLSNILITVLFLTFGIMGFKKALKIKIIRVVYGPAVLYMTITGIVFWTLLHGGRDHQQLLPWVTIMLHGIMPIAVLFAWIVFHLKTKLTYVDAIKWLAFPLLFVVYTLLRGPFIGWYPYVILNPATAGGYVGVAGYVFEIIIGAFIGAVILIYLNNLLNSRR